MAEPMSDERLARLAADNEPTGDHLSGLTADEVAELVAETKRARAEAEHLRAERLILGGLGVAHAPKDQCAHLFTYERSVFRCQRQGDHDPALHRADLGGGGSIEWAAPQQPEDGDRG